jgi:hypothetical protein
VVALERGADTAACEAAAALLQAHADDDDAVGGGASWPRLAAAGALPALLSSPALRPGAHGRAFASRASRCLAALHAAWTRARGRAAQALALPQRDASGADAGRAARHAQPGLNGAHRAAFHRRAAHCAERAGYGAGAGAGASFWDAAVTLMA